jgi:beta-phosphoglucomutase-like phosphatase (HAD superfamily)
VLVSLRAVVFDFDGVIANSEPLHFKGYRDVLAPEGVTLGESEYYTRYLGFDDVGAFEAIAADHALSWSADTIARLVARKAARLEELEREGSILFPGAREAIVRLAGACPIAIASGALGHEITRVLERTQLASFFTTIVSAEDTPASKPAPDPYRLAVERLRDVTKIALTPGECVAIEDSVWGLLSARAAGLRTIAITHTYAAETLTASSDAIVTHLDQLTIEYVRSVVIV